MSEDNGEEPAKVIGELIGKNKHLLLSAVPFAMAVGMEVVEVGPTTLQACFHRRHWCHVVYARLSLDRGSTMPAVRR